jgi:hypothetical protein
MLKPWGLNPPALFIPISPFIVYATLGGHFRFTNEKALTFTNGTDPLIQGRGIHG